MIDWVLSIFLVAHGWAHIWYVILSRQLISYEKWMAWTGESWLLSGLLGDSVTRLIASMGYTCSLIGFIVSGVMLYMGRPVWRKTMLASSILSTIMILLFWDGRLSMLKEKGIIGILINLALIIFTTRLS
jgi:hypothetical protein